MTETATMHASCVAWQGQGVLITGAAGAGKSTLALSLMALGCQLVADDRTAISQTAQGLLARAPQQISGRIEARGIGVLNATPIPVAHLALVVDLDRTETKRLPPLSHITLLGSELPLIYRVDGPQFVPAILQLLKAGRSAL